MKWIKESKEKLGPCPDCGKGMEAKDQYTAICPACGAPAINLAGKPKKWGKGEPSDYAVWEKGGHGWVNENEELVQVGHMKKGEIREDATEAEINESIRYWQKVYDQETSLYFQLKDKAESAARKAQEANDNVRSLEQALNKRPSVQKQRQERELLTGE